ncbi:hypothetical protein OU798_08480 [Prolixibacteraceae bacterium Z1-6]|uniref:Uncharacterized protein n=1 Tax=Draconibacterium aestuarii TaxID=2998507 RepID=A0A9X3J763_9BACT|nr:hypothetical protein [Prolixibacteraceae bacterium Z1-6]
MKQNTSKLLFAGSWLINLILPFFVFGVFKDSFLRIYYNSDTLYLASVYKDVFVDGTGFQGWNLNGAPNFFPDMLMYFVIRFFTGDFRIAYIIFSAVQYNLLVFLLGSLFRGINSKVSLNYITLFNLLFPVYLLATILHGSFQYTFDVFSQSYHNGCFINSLLAINFFFRYLTREKKSYLIYMLVFVFLGAFNDRLFIVTFVAPAIALFVINVVWIKKKTITRSTLLALGVAIIALLAFIATKRNSVYECIDLGEKFMNFSNAGPSFQNMLKQHTDFIVRTDLRGLVTGLTIFSFFTLLGLFFMIARKTSWFKQAKQNELIAALFIVFSLSSVFLTLFTPVVNGYYLGPSCIRYTTFSFFLSLFNVVFIVYYLTGMKEGVRWQHPVIGVLLLFYGVVVVFTVQSKPVFETITKVATYYPEKVKAVDEFTQKHKVQYGVAGYWDAKYTTMFSKNEVRVYTAINEKLNLWYHVMNSNWYYKHDKGKYKDPEFRFVILSPEKFKTTREIFGEPIDSMQVEKGSFIYLIHEFEYDRETRKPRPINWIE